VGVLHHPLWHAIAAGVKSGHIGRMGGLQVQAHQVGIETQSWLSGQIIQNANDCGRWAAPLYFFMMRE
jgi:hypothetical protein